MIIIWEMEKMYAKKDRKALIVVNEIKKLILERNPVRLPSENQLAQRYGVSRTIIREALRILEYEGITHTVQGSGTYVKKRDGINISIDISLEVRSNDPKQILELIEVRRCLESGAIRLAIMNANDEQIKELEETLLALESSIEKHEVLSEVDEKFHKKIFEIANNEILRKTFDAIFSVLGILWHSPLGMKNFGDRGLPYHRLLFEKIRERNLEKALGIYQKIIDLDIEDIREYEHKSRG